MPTLIYVNLIEASGRQHTQFRWEHPEMLTPAILLSHLHGHRRFFMAYMALTGFLNLLWEVLQLPLYTLWHDSMPFAIAFAVVHCTLGDVLIALFALLAALTLAGTPDWPRKRYWIIALTAGALGLVYTAFSEWNNTVVIRPRVELCLGAERNRPVSLGPMVCHSGQRLWVLAADIGRWRCPLLKRALHQHLRC